MYVLLTFSISVSLLLRAFDLPLETRDGLTYHFFISKQVHIYRSPQKTYYSDGLGPTRRSYIERV